MLHIDNLSRVPIYQQIIDETRREIALGLIQEGSILPSVRELSSSLNVNPNTVQKAYIELSRAGLISSVPGKGNVVLAGASASTQNSKLCEQKQRFEDAARYLLDNGMSAEDLADLIRTIQTKGD